MTFDDTVQSAASLLVERRQASERVMRGKAQLLTALRVESVELLRESLKVLSTTKLASKRESSSSSSSKIIETLPQHLEINVAAVSPALFSTTIGPQPVHTDLARCLLTPQSYIEEKDGISIVLSTNAVSLLETPCDSRNPGMTPLAKACQCGNPDLALLLLEHGADPNVCSNDGLTPLIRMAKIGNLEMVQLLLLEEPESDSNSARATEEEAPPAASATTTTATHSSSSKCPFVAHSNYWPSVNHKRLRKVGALQQQLHTTTNRWGTDLFRYDQQAMSALIHACTENKLAVARYLVHHVSCHNLNANAATDFVNDYKVDPAVWYASAHGNASIVRFLMDECGARTEYRKDPTVYSSTPLEEACEWGHDDVVQVLLEREGSDPRTVSGRKARALAARAGYHKVVERMDAWKHRLDAVEEWVNSNENDDEGRDSHPLAFLPSVLEQCARRSDLVYRIVSRHVINIVCCANGIHSGTSRSAFKPN